MKRLTLRPTPQTKGRRGNAGSFSARIVNGRAVPVWIDSAGHETLLIGTPLGTSNTRGSSATTRANAVGLAVPSVAPSFATGGANICRNSSFEVDSDADGTPDGWLVYSSAGGGEAITTTRAIDGTPIPFGSYWLSMYWSAANTGHKYVYTQDGTTAGGLKSAWQANQWYTVSWYAGGWDDAPGSMVGRTMDFIDYGGNEPDDKVWISRPAIPDLNVGADPVQYVCKFRWTTTALPGSNWFAIGMTYGDGSYGFLYLDGVKLELGEFPTAWSPAADEVTTGMSDAMQRAINAIASDNSRVRYRGNNDSATKGGAPNISCLSVTINKWSAASNFGRVDFKIQPTGVSDNLDGLRYAKIVWMKQNVLYNNHANNPTLTNLATTYEPLCDRLYQTPGTDSNSGNACYATPFLLDGNLANYPAFAITLYNVYGPSDTHCFYCNTSGADGTTLTDGGTSFPAGFSGGTSGGSGGGSGGGGNCPAPWVPIRMHDGEDCAAGDLHAHDLVCTCPDGGDTYSVFPVTHVTHTTADCLRLVLEDGREVVASEGHRFRVRGDWKALRRLRRGDDLDGSRPGRVAQVTTAGRGPVVRITVADAATYECDGLLCHNMKPIDG